MKPPNLIPRAAAVCTIFYISVSEFGRSGSYSRALSFAGLLFVFFLLGYISKEKN